MTPDPSPTASVDPSPTSPRPERPAPPARLVRPADFERVLATPLRLRSVHFALHHVDDVPLPARPRATSPPPPAASPAASQDASPTPPPGTVLIHAPVDPSLSTDLSTGVSGNVDTGVDDCGRWLGLVVPKRHAKRAVTRALLKRQIRDIAARCGHRLPSGCWVVRQRAPFDPARFVSAASDALRREARAELLALFERAVKGERDVPKPRRPADGARRTSGRAG